MTSADNLLARLSLKESFYDRHERRAYLRAVEIARHIVNDPEAKARARTFLHKHVAADPHQRHISAVWFNLLERTPEQIVRALLEDSDQGAELRATAPVFAVLESEVTKRLWAAAP